VQIYMTTYALDTLRLDPGLAFGVNIVQAVCVIIFSMTGGALCDRYGRRPVMLWPTLAGMAVVWPVFFAINHSPGAASLLGGMAIVASLGALSQAPVIVALTETLPANIRSGAVAIVYAFAISIFGGATQFVLAKAIHATGDPMAPAWFLIAALGAGVPAILFLRESAPAKAAA
jgi:MFS family permease